MSLQILIPLLTALIGGFIGTYFGSYLLQKFQEGKIEKVRLIAINALKILKKYSNKPFSTAENEFNTSLSIVEKRSIIVALHKLGIPIGTMSDEAFNINEIHFVGGFVVDEKNLSDISKQIEEGYCDQLFYIDPEKHFTANYALYALRNAAKRYVNKVLKNSRLDNNTNAVETPLNWGNDFSLGELKSVVIFSEQVNVPFIFSDDGKPKIERLESLLKEIDLGLWDSYLTWNYEIYRNAMCQLKIGQQISSGFQITAQGICNKVDREG